MRKLYAGHLLLLPWFLSGTLGCGTETYNDVPPGLVAAGMYRLGVASAVRAQPLVPDTFGPAFSATIAWSAFTKNSGEGCSEAVSQVNAARQDLSVQVEWAGILDLQVWRDANLAWAGYYDGGCSSVGVASALVPMPTQCGNLRNDLSAAWTMVTTASAYQSLVAQGIIPALEEAFTAASDAGCVY